MILKAQMQTVGDKTVIRGLRWYASDRWSVVSNRIEKAEMT